jgi:hypothetical protein
LGEEEGIEAHMQWLKQKLHIKSVEDWYDITREQVEEASGAATVLLRKWGGYVNFLSKMYPSKYNQRRQQFISM